VLHGLRVRVARAGVGGRAGRDASGQIHRASRGIGTMTDLELDGREIRRFTRTPNRQRARASIRPYDLAD
jgi:hypothetical protein